MRGGLGPAPSGSSVNTVTELGIPQRVVGMSEKNARSRRRLGLLRGSEDKEK